MGIGVVSEAQASHLRALLQQADLDVIGHLSGASNATLACSLRDPASDEDVACVYKPRRGERPLWDFATGSLGYREVASGLLDEILGWNLLPVTIWREEGPLGPGMCQLWIEDDPGQPAVDVVAPSDLQPGWLVVLEATTYDGHEVVLAHEDSLDLRRLALFDVVANNADRKGGHVLRDPHGQIKGIDHGLTFHGEPKMRTVLWGWAGEPIDDPLLVDLERLRSSLTGSHGARGTLEDLLTSSELSALIDRIDRLLDDARFPQPEARDHPALPWPVM